ncbi:MAG: hypothetical protein HYR91_04115 [Flavobacteriia bacterium]|nr:hypothetical protein [Flavobacteriia bacterium]
MKLIINYSLKSGIQGEIPIIATLNFGYKEFDVLKNEFIYKPLRYYIGLKLKKEEWDAKSKIPYNKSKYAELLKIEEQIINTFKYLEHKKDLTPENFKLELDSKIKGKEDSKIIQRLRIVDFIREEIIKTKAIKSESLKPYTGLANKLEKFEEKIGKLIYTNDLNEELYLQFINEAKNRLSKINGVWAIQKTFKATINEISRKYKITIFNPTVDLAQKDKIQAVSVDAIYLNFHHINSIIKYKPETEKLKNTKLILLTLLFTGCRESDVYKIIPIEGTDKNGNKFLYARYLSQKTDTEIVVPILKPLENALKENKFQPPNPISQQKFNEYVKELVALAKLKDDVTISFVNAQGKKEFQTKKFYDFVTSHIGRRSFVTNLINYVPITILTKITGHTLKDKSIIFGYNKISLIDNAIQFRKILKQACDENKDHFVFKLV